MIHPCPNCGKATPVWPSCSNHSYIVTTDATSVATGNIVWPLTPSQITLTCDNCSKLRDALSQAQQALRRVIETFEPIVKRMEMTELPFAVPNNSAARAAIQLANSKGKEMREVITLAEAALPSDAPEGAALRKGR